MEEWKDVSGQLAGAAMPAGHTWMRIQAGQQVVVTKVHPALPGFWVASSRQIHPYAWFALSAKDADAAMAEADEMISGAKPKQERIV